MTECLQSHAELQNDLVGARERFRDEQARQSFAPPAPIGTVDLVHEVLTPLLLRPAAGVSDLGETMLHAFAGVAAPTLLSFGPFVDVLVRAPAAPDAAPDLSRLSLTTLTSTSGGSTNGMRLHSTA